MAGDSTATPGRDLPAGSGPTQVDSQTGWQSATPRDTKRGRPPDSTSHPASPHADFRPRILGIEFRLSTRPLGPGSSEAGASPHPCRLSALRRHGPVEIFRPRPTRRIDGAGVPQSQRQTVANADRALPAHRASWSTPNCSHRPKARCKAVLFRHCWRTSCWMISTKSWNLAASALCVTRTTSSCSPRRGRRPGVSSLRSSDT